MRLHGEIVLHRQIFAKGDISHSFRLRVERAVRRYVVRHGQVAVLRDQVRVLSGFQLSVHAKGDIVGIAFFIRRPRGLHRNIPGRRGSLPLDGNLPFFGQQLHILFRRHRFHIRPVVADRDIAFPVADVNASVFGNDGLGNIDLAFARLDRDILLRFHVAVAVVAYDHVPGPGLQIRLAPCRQIFADKDIARACLHGEVAVYGHVHAKPDIALVGDIDRHIALGCRVARDCNISVVSFQCQVTPGEQLAVLVDDKVLAVLFAPRAHPDIAALAFRFAVDGYLAVFRNQVDVLLRRYRVHILPVVADCDIALLVVDVYASIFGDYGLGNIDFAFARSDGDILIRFHGAIAVMAYSHVSGPGLQIRLAPCRQVFADKDVALFRLHGEIAVYGYIHAKSDIALARNIDGHVALGHRVARNGNIPVVGFQCQIAPGEQLTVLVDDNVLAVLLAPRAYLDIAVLAFRFAVDGHLAVIRDQVDVLFRRYCFRIRPVVANRDIAFLVVDVYASVFGNDSLGNIDKARACLDRDILLRFHVAVALEANDYISGAGQQIHLAACRQILADKDASRARLHGEVAVYGYLPAKPDIALVLDCDRHVALGHRLVRDGNISVVGFQRQVAAGNQLAVLVDDKIPVLLLAPRVQLDIAVPAFRFAVDGDRAVVRDQVDVLFRRYRFHIRPVVADPDIAFLVVDGHASVVRNHGPGDADCTFARFDGDILLRLHVAVAVDAHEYVAVAGPQIGLASRRQILADIDASRACLHGEVAVYGYVHAKHDIALARDIDRHVALGRRLVRDDNISVVSLQRQILPGDQLAVLGDDKARSVLLAPRMQPDIAVPAFRFAEDGHLAVVRDQVDILFRRYRVRIRPVGANPDIAVLVVDGHASIVRTHGLQDIDSAFARLDGDVPVCFHVAVALVAHDYVAGAGPQVSLASRRQILADVNAARARLHGEIAVYRDIHAKPNIALALDIDCHVALGHRVVRDLDIPVVGFQRQVAPGNQLAVLVDDKAPLVLLAPGAHRDIAVPAFRLAEDGYRAVIREQADILLRRHRFHIRPVVADGDIALLAGNVHIPVVGNHGLDDIDIAFARPDRNILVGFHISLIAHSLVAYKDISLPAADRHGLPGGDILSYPDIAGAGLQADRSLVRADLAAHADGSLVRENIHVIFDGHMAVKEDVPLLLDVGRNAAVPCQDVVRDMDIAVAPVKSDRSAGIQLAVVPDDKVSGVLRIAVQSGAHRNVAGSRGRLALDGHGSKPGPDVDILVRQYRFLIRRVVGADDDISRARLRRHAPMPGFDGLGDENVARAGNIRGDVPAFRGDVTAKRDISIALHLETGRVARPERSIAVRVADIDAAVLGAGACDLNLNVPARDHSFLVRSNISSRVARRHADVVSCLHAPADTGKRAVRAADDDILFRVGVSQQLNVIFGIQDNAAFGFDFFVLILGIPEQQPQGAVLVTIGKFHVAPDACPHACRKGIILFPGIIVGHDLDTAVDCVAAPQGVRQESCELVLLAFHGHAFSAVDLHHGRTDRRARRFADSAARADAEGIVIPGQFPGRHIHAFGLPRPGGDVAANGNIPAKRGERHVIGRRQRGTRLQAAAGLQRNIALGIRPVAVRAKRRQDIEAALGAPVFRRNIPLDGGRNGNIQLVRLGLDRDTALNGRVLLGALHGNRSEPVARSLQIHAPGAGGGELLRLDSRLCVLRDRALLRGQAHALARLDARRRSLRDVPLARGQVHALAGRNRGILHLFQAAVADSDELARRRDVSENQGSVLDAQRKALHPVHIGGVRHDVHPGAVIENAEGIRRLAHDAENGIRLEIQILARVDIGRGKVGVGIAHLEAAPAVEGNRVSRVHGAQTEIRVFHVLDEDILLGPRPYQIPGQGNGQRLRLGADALLASREEQIVSRDIGRVGIQRVVDALVGVQAHVALCGGVAHVEGGVFPGLVGAPRHGDIAARVHGQRSGRPHAQRHIGRNHEGRHIAVQVPHSLDIGSVRIHELLHALDLLASGQIRHRNRRGGVGNGAHRALARGQGDIPAQHIGRPLGLRAAAGIGVHQFFADGVKHHVLRPLEGGLRRLRHHILVGGVIRQVSVRVGVPGILVSGGILQIRFRRRVIGILGILLGALRVRQESAVPLVRQIPALVLGECVVFRLIGKIIFICGRVINRLHRRLLVGVFGFPLRLRLARIGKLHVRLVVVAVFFQTFDVRALVGIVSFRVLLAVDEAGVDPAVHHLVHAGQGLGVRVAWKRVNEAAVFDGQRHIPGLGLDLAHAHIAAVCHLGQIDIAVRGGVDRRTGAIHRIDEIRAHDFEGFRRRANGAVFADEIDVAAFHDCPQDIILLRDIPGGGKGHTSDGRVAPAGGSADVARKACYFHVPRQRPVVPQAADGGDIDAARPVGNGVEPDVIRHVAVRERRADGGDMDVFDVAFRDQAHMIALQQGVVVLEDSSRRGADVQRRLVVGVRHVARQVDIAAVGVGAPDIDAAFFRADQPEGDGLGGVDGIVVRPEGSGFFRPTGIVVLEPTQESRLFQPSCFAGDFTAENFGIGINTDLSCLRNIGAVLPNGSPFGQPVLSALLFADFCDVLAVALDLAHILGLDQAPHAVAHMVLLGYRPAFELAVRPVIGLIRFGFGGDCVIDGKRIGANGGVPIGIVLRPVLSHIRGIAPDFAGLPFPELEPRVIGHVYDGNDALPLIVEDFAHVHIVSGVVRHGDIRRAVRRHHFAIAGAGDLARQIDLATRRVDIFHEQLFRGRIPIDLRHIVKDLVRIVPLRAAVVDLEHGAVLDDGHFVGVTCHRPRQIVTIHRGGVVFVAALDEAVDVDIGRGHIDIPASDVARSFLGRIRTRVGFGSIRPLLNFAV